MIDTAAVATTLHPPSRRRLLRVALALSLTLNLFFVAGVAWTRLHPPAPAGFLVRMHAVAAQLDLDPQQHRAFTRYLTTVHAHYLAMRQQIDPLMLDAWAEIGKPQPDRATIDRLFDSAAQQRRAFQRAAMTITLSFLATLTPQQRAKFVALAERQHGHWGHPVKPKATR